MKHLHTRPQHQSIYRFGAIEPLEVTQLDRIERQTGQLHIALSGLLVGVLLALALGGTALIALNLCRLLA